LIHAVGLLPLCLLQGWDIGKLQLAQTVVHLGLERATLNGCSKVRHARIFT
jgi:hypothetical protein